jgi:hypothetical protein
MAYYLASNLGDKLKCRQAKAQPERAEMLAKRFNTSLQIPEALPGTSMQQDCYPLVLCWQFV